ncbi:LysR family transcriptional regulator [Ureibacillus sp. FSL K6-8385]|uniref:LysR family transcriptional regulator n=1 Tax=Ureibacillus terrenus TaxID=118246 RepID=A0A540UX30_9BACL|nr:LysR family transcriptional regulator [Ureibacillus terrenus]MED3662825.1 LysR family transcriptional regulator [Ureibacillus terrenus]MED3762878.1 LysR family transcriptional regulator [Ureibacillus terrenus]TQE89039.1 LysR family transcriptional regulator [Ureibacillus terrenus]
MELRQLEYFIALATELHFTRAAKKLHISQPTLSHQIKALEEEVGTQLFDRIGKRITLTEAGKILHEQSMHILHLIENTKQQLNELELFQRGTLKIGALPGELTSLVSNVLLTYAKEFPYVQISVQSADDVLSMLKENQIEFALSYIDDSNQAIDGQFCQIPLYTDSFVFVAAKDHPLLEKDELTLREIACEPLILFTKLQTCRKILNQAAKQEQISLNPVFETSDIHTIFHFVKEKLGCAIVSESLYQFHRHENIDARPIVNSRLNRKMVLIYRKDKYLSKAAKSFIPILIQRLEKFDMPLPPASRKKLMLLASKESCPDPLQNGKTT